MSREDVIEVEGIVVEALRNAQFVVRLQNGHNVLAYVSGKLRIHSIKIVAGDAVKGLHLYGAKIIYPKEMVFLNLTPAAEDNI